VGINKIIIHGGGGHAKVVADCLLAQEKKIIAFIDPKCADAVLGIPCFPDYDPTFETDAQTIIAIGNNAARKKLHERIVHSFDNAIHPSAVISTLASMGVGNMILHHAVIQAGAVLGNHVIINTGAQVDHDCHIDDFVHIAPRAVLCGNVTVGQGALVGAGAVITPGRKIGHWATVGAGAVVIQDVPERAVVVGNPARIIKYDLT
jgi:sugar O-acyltransferase (sialic acid O-acetyltransferase NeuD family)